MVIYSGRCILGKQPFGFVFDQIGKLDQILNAIKLGQVIMLDGKTLVGSTAVRYDNELGQRRVLAERGAL